MKKLFFLLIFLCPLFVIAQPCATWTSVVSTNVSCNGDTTGSIVATATATATPITYSMMPNIGAQTSAGNFSGLPAGNYVITATDANNCVTNSTVTITEPIALLISSVNVLSPSCVPGMDGTICVTASGGTPVYLYSTNIFSQISNCFTNVGAGIYTVTVSDANGCTAVTAVSVIPPAAPIITSVINQNTNSCDPDTIQVNTIPGSSQNLNYTMNPFGLLIGPGTFVTPTSGNYTVTVSDANNCSASTIVNSNANAAQLTSSQIVQPPCGTTNGSITVSANWPNTTFSYVLNPGNISNTTGVFNNLGPGNYTVSLQSASCSTALSSFQLVSALNPYPMTITQNSFTATIPTNGTPPYVYRLNGQVIPNPQSGLRCTGVDSFSITDAGGCTFDTVFNFVSGNSFPSITLNKNITDATCTLTGDGQIIYAPSSPLTYDWIANSMVSGSTSNSISSLMPDMYVVRLHNASGDCIHDTSTVGTIGTNCGNISGKTFYDHLNINCSLDTLELPVSNATVTLMPGNLQTISNANGEFQFNGLAYGNYVVEVDTNTVLAHYPSCNLIQYDTLSASNNNITNNFPYDSIVSTDIFIYTLSTPKVPAAPFYSFQKTQRISYGTSSSFLSTSIPVNIYALMDSMKHYHSASITPTAINGDTLMWTTTISNPWNTISVYFDSLQSLAINQTIPFKVWIEPTSSIIGNNPTNDISSVLLPILTSYDPNDKQVSPQGSGVEGFIDPSVKELSYLVRFQNTGNAMAYNVFIEDTISNRLDINSIQVLGASHNYLVEKENNLIRFRFNNIMLPDSNADEPNSHGFVQYTIQQDPGNISGDVINNTAYIYFDYNPAVITNTTVNTIAFPISVEQIEKSKFKVYPNPTKDFIYINSASEKIERIAVYNLVGKEILSNQNDLNLSTQQISLANLPLGVYLLQINNEVLKIIKR